MTSSGMHVALAMLQPLAVFELTQLVSDADQHVGIGADTKCAAGVEEFARRKDSVAEVCLGDRAEARDGASAGERA